jgi:hypothetical protein
MINIMLQREYIAYVANRWQIHYETKAYAK